MHTIVVGVDGSEPSIRALRFAARLSEDLANARLVVAHARYVPSLWAPKHVPEAEFSDLLDEADQFVRETAEGVLEGGDVPWSSSRAMANPRTCCATSRTNPMRASSSSDEAVGRPFRSFSSVRCRTGSCTERDVNVLLVH